MVCDTILNAYLATLKAGFHCQASGDGRLSVVTPYLYPDHDFIEVFVKEHEDGTVVVSDLGETLRHLDTQGMDVMGTAGLKYASERIATGLRVDMQNGAIFKKGKPDEVGQTMFDVVTAVKLVSSLLFGNKSYEPASFQ